MHPARHAQSDAQCHICTVSAITDTAIMTRGHNYRYNQKLCFLSLMFQMQPINQVFYNKVMTSVEFISTSIKNIVTAAG